MSKKIKRDYFIAGAGIAGVLLAIFTVNLQNYSQKKGG
jgi:hypothetical protein